MTADARMRGTTWKRVMWARWLAAHAPSAPNLSDQSTPMSDADSAGGSASAVNDGELLREALRITTGDRRTTYGHASDNLGRTARLMTAYLHGLDRPLNAADVAAVMICVKLARLHVSPGDYGTLLDIAGYASAAWDAVNNGTA